MIVFETARLCVQWVLPAGAQEEANSWNQLVGKHASQTGHEPVPDALESRLKLIRHARSGRLAASQEASSGWDTLRANSIAEQMPSKREHVPGALCSVSVEDAPPARSGRCWRRRRRRHTVGTSSWARTRCRRRMCRPRLRRLRRSQ